MTQRLHTKRLLSAVFAAGLLFSVSGCSDNHLYTPTFQVTNKMQVKKQKFETITPTKEVSDSELSNVSYHYEKHGEGRVNILVTYNPEVAGNSALRATDEAARISDSLRMQGVTNLQAEILPVQDHESQTVISYIGYTAEKPEGCDINAMEQRDVHANEMQRNYEYGCTMMDYMTRQIARPRDLLGSDKISPATGNRESISVRQYESNELEAIQGITTDSL